MNGKAINTYCKTYYGLLLEDGKMGFVAFDNKAREMSLRAGNEILKETFLLRSYFD